MLLANLSTALGLRLPGDASRIACSVSEGIVVDWRTLSKLPFEAAPLPTASMPCAVRQNEG